MRGLSALHRAPEWELITGYKVRISFASTRMLVRLGSPAALRRRRLQATITYEARSTFGLEERLDSYSW